MKAVVQRVNSARVQIGDQTVGKISRGLLFILVSRMATGLSSSMAGGKIVNLRIFDRGSTLQPSDPELNLRHPSI